MVDQKAVSEDERIQKGAKDDVKEENGEGGKEGSEERTLEEKVKDLKISDKGEDEEEGKLIERGPVRVRDERKEFRNDRGWYGYYQQELPRSDPTNRQESTLIDAVIVPSLTDTQLLTIANSSEFRAFVETENRKTVVPISKPTRRESQDSSYFSDNSVASPDPGSPATPQRRSAREAFRAGLDEKAKLKTWVRLNLMGDGELFRVDDEGKSRLHHLLLDNRDQPHLKENFYSLVEAMVRRSQKEFSNLTRKEPTIRKILEEKHRDFLDYFQEVELSLG